MTVLTQAHIDAAIAGSEWDLGNRILYDLCAKHPGHNQYDQIIAKIWLIGRSYAAAIERRRSSHVNASDDFYIRNVAPSVRHSPIDSWFDELRKFSSIDKQSIPTILNVHLLLTTLFNEISGLEKRSLASKYLHFHFPHLYFIYDSRAVLGVSALGSYTGRMKRSEYEADNEYRKLFEKCVSLRSSIKSSFGADLTPRQIDNLLLSL